MPKYTIEKWNGIADKLCKDNDLTRLEEFKSEDCVERRKIFKVITKEGYIVYPSIDSLRRNQQPFKFSTTNPYTIYNIKLWIKLNNKKIELVSEKYKDSQQEMKWLCKNNECKSYNKEFSKPWFTIQQGHCCRDCGIRKIKYARQKPQKGKSLLEKNQDICNKYWDYKRNDKIPDQYYSNSGQYVYWKCDECNYQLPNKLKINMIVRYGLSCPRCSDSISYPEKFIFNVLMQLLDKDFKKQLTKTTFKWCNKYKYDFYIPIINGIVEAMGLQHYKGTSGKWSLLAEVQQNDIDKENLAKENNIKNYVSIDCRKSEMEWIKNSIIKSELPKLLNFKESDIDWLKCHKYACSNLVKEVANAWDKGVKREEIEKIYDLSAPTVIQYLKQGDEIGWCIYNAKEEMKRNGYENGKRNGKQGKSIVQLTKKGEYINQYESILEATKVLNLWHISSVCNKHRKTTGGFIFMFKEEYIKNGGYNYEF